VEPGVEALGRVDDAAVGVAQCDRDRVATALGVEPPAPDTMLGSMAVLPMPGVDGDAEAAALSAALEADERIQVPIGGWPVPAARGDGGVSAIHVRISAQRYNEPSDYERLADALARRLGIG